MREYADLVWLENLNLRGQFKGTIMAYIREKHPELVPLYEDIYNRRRTDYWQALEREMADYAAANGMPYLREGASGRGQLLLPRENPPLQPVTGGSDTPGRGAARPEAEGWP